MKNLTTAQVRAFGAILAASHAADDGPALLTSNVDAAATDPTLFKAHGAVLTSLERRGLITRAHDVPTIAYRPAAPIDLDGPFIDIVDALADLGLNANDAEDVAGIAAA